MNRRIFNKIAKREGLVKAKPEPVRYCLIRRREPKTPDHFIDKELETLICAEIQKNGNIYFEHVLDNIIEASMTVFIKIKKD